MLHVTDFKHYLYVAAPIGFVPTDCANYKVYLESQVGNHQPTIHTVNMCMRENLYGYQGNEQHPYLKITVTDPKFIARVRRAIEDGNANWQGRWKTPDGSGKLLTFDSIAYVLRFMIDTKVCELPLFWYACYSADHW